MAIKIPVKAIPGGGAATALGEFEPGDTIDPAFLPTDPDVAIGDIEDEGVTTGGGPYTIINFTGPSIQAADAGGGKATVDVIDSIEDIEQDGVSITGPFQILNFIAPLNVVDAGGGQADISITGAELQAGVVFPGQWGYMSAGGKGDKMKGNGLLTDTEAVDNASSVVVLATGVAMEQDTDGTNNDQIQSRAKDQFYRLDNGLLMIQKFTFTESVDFRSFCGLYDDGGADATDTDDIQNQGIGILFSTSRDTNFQFVGHDGTTQVLVDTTVLKDALPHYVVVRENVATPGNYNVELRNGDFSTIQASTTFTAAQLGLATVGLRLLLETKALAAATKQHHHYHGSIVLEGV
jgi:hypothetical protein